MAKKKPKKQRKQKPTPQSEPSESLKLTRETLQGPLIVTRPRFVGPVKATRG
jgi:hypothetical protein